MNFKPVRQAGRDTSTKAKVLVAIVITIIVLPHFWNVVCAPLWFGFTQ